MKIPINKKYLITFSLVFVFLLLLNLEASNGANICCKISPEPDAQKRCFSTGICCRKGSTKEEYWSEKSCFDFSIWTSGSRSFRVGQKTPIFLYLENNGSYIDSYDINYTIEPANTVVIKLDMSGVSPVIDAEPNVPKRLQPQITVLSTTANGIITFNATSRGDNSIKRNATFKVMESDFSFSLPDFNALLMIQVMIFTGLIYIIDKKVMG